MNILTIKWRQTLRAAGAQLLALSFITAIASPAFAVVFTNPAPITVNDATTIGTGNPYPSNIAVSGLTGTVTNVTVTLNNLTSTFPDDTDILLVAPNGNNLILMSDTGGSDDITNTTMTFDDAAITTLPDATKLLTGVFKPTNVGTGDTFPAPAPAPSANTTLAASFNGIDPNGTWNLYVVDDLGADMGVFGNGWSITVTTTGSAATTFVNGAAVHGGDGGRGRATPYASSITASGLTGAIIDINVTLTNLSHLNPDDLDVMLIGPSGKRITLLSDAGGTTDAVGVTLTFDDGAPAVIPDAGPMVTGIVKPTNFGTGDTYPDLTGPYVYSSTAGTATLASVFNGTEGNGVWTLYIVDDVTASAGSVAGGWSIDITAGGTYGAKRFTSADFGGDGRTEVGIYRPSDGNWWLRDSSTFGNSVTRWGTTGDVPIPADYDGDGKTDLAIFRPSSGTWIVVNSATSSVTFTPWGNSTDTLVPEDYDGDGKIDVAIWRGSTATYWVRQSSNSATRIVKWGTTGDLPVRGHFEGTNGADFAVFRPSDGNWYILDNAAASSRQIQWGIGTDKPVAADYDADGKTDVAVWRPSDGNWFIVLSSTSTASIFHWGQNGDTPVPGDYDGDSKADAAVWRAAESGWYLLNSGTPPGAAAIRTDSWGLTGDIALPATYLP